MYVAPDFKVEAKADSYLVTPQLADGVSVVNEYVYVDNLKSGSSPYVGTRNFERDRVLLTELSDGEAMWLYQNGEIKTER